MARSTIVVDGVDICKTYGLILLSTSEVAPPEPVYNMLDIPGRDGQLDLTESLTGDTVYSNRVNTLVFGVGSRIDKFEEIKTRLSNFLHGRRYEYEMTVDPGHIYTGRFAIDSYYSQLNYGEIKFVVTSDPWKRADHISLDVPAANGVEVHAVNRRRRVSPTVTALRDTVIGYKTHSWSLEPGTHYLNELVLDPGDNIIFVDSKPYDGTNTWSDVVSKLGSGLTWQQVSSYTWAQLAKYGQTFSDDATTTVTIEYDTYDL